MYKRQIKKTAFKVTRVGQLVAKEASKRLDVPFGIIDLSLAPTPVSYTHLPWEIISKSDLYEAKKGYLAFLKNA